jgi:hypothetical protein
VKFRPVGRVQSLNRTASVGRKVSVTDAPKKRVVKDKVKVVFEDKAKVLKNENLKGSDP